MIKLPSGILSLNKIRFLFPWRVQFAIMIFSKEPVIRKFVKIQDYIDGYGLGELEQHEFGSISIIFVKNSAKYL